MPFTSLIESLFSSLGGLAAGSSGTAANVLSTLKTAKGFFSAAGAFAITSELSKELGPLSVLIPWGKFQMPFAKSFNKQYEMIAAKDVTSRLRDIEMPVIKKPDTQNAAKFISSSKI